MIAAPSLNRCEKLSLLSIGYKSDLPPSAARLLHLFIDNAASLLWSSERLAKAIRRSLSTVERSLAELRSLGIISTVRRRRQTCIKVLCVERIRALGEQGVAAAKAACAAAIALVRQGKSLIPHFRRPISISDIKQADEKTPWRLERPPSASLLRLMGMLTGEKRRGP